MSTLTIMQGLPASGKTTRARQIVAESGNTVRLNRDDLRAMLFESRWSGPREDLVVRLEKAMAHEALAAGWNVVVDDTNLSNRAINVWREFGREHAVKMQWQRMKTDVHLCISRDERRNGRERVGRAVIENMALKAGMAPVLRDHEQIVIFDLDGTLANCDHRLHLLEGPDGKDWDAFMSRCGDDPPNIPVVRWAQEVGQDYCLVIVSGRNAKYYPITFAWLVRHQLYPDHIFMRQDGDCRPDYVVKTEMVQRMPVDRIAFAVDDRPSLIEKCWRALGIKVYPVNQERWEGRE